jgi:sirohydrochlorin cobaltochelatase
MDSKIESTPDSPAKPSTAGSPLDGLPPTGLLLVGHGTREPAGIAEFDELARKVAARLAPKPVAPCFLELAEPGIAEGIDRLAAQGVRRLLVAPVLLFAAAHAKRDIPEAVAAAVERWPGMTWRQVPHLGLDRRVFELSARRLAEAVVSADPDDDSPNPISPDETLLIVVGRGSRDPEALAEFDEFARRHALGVGYSQYRPALMAMAEPPLPDVLREAAAGSFRRVVVEPHLLFGGVLVDRLRDQVAEFRRLAPDKQWVVANHLGPDDLLASALAEAAAEVPLPARGSSTS